MDIRREPDSAWLRIIKPYLENRKMFGEDKPELSAIEDGSDQTRLTKMLLALGAKRAKERGLSPDSGEAQDLIEEAFRTANGITYAFPLLDKETDKDTARRAFRMAWSARPVHLIHDAQEHYRMDVDGAYLEHGVGQYLDSDFKDPRIDRLLVRALADMELSAFLCLQFGFKGIGFPSPLKEASKSVVWTWITNRLIALVITVAITAALIALKIYVPGTPDWLVLGGVGLSIVGFILVTAYSLVALIVYGPRVAAERKRVLDTIKAAVDFYTEFHDPGGTISLAHYRRRMEEAKDKGIVWPQSLWALIDDMEHRGVRHF